MRTRKPRPYFTLAVRIDGRWSPEFGDFDRETVEAERQDYRDHDHKARDLKIITTAAGGRAVMDAIDKLNNAGARPLA